MSVMQFARKQLLYYLLRLIAGQTVSVAWNIETGGTLTVTQPCVVHCIIIRNGGLAILYESRDWEEWRKIELEKAMAKIGGGFDEG